MKVLFVLAALLPASIAIKCHVCTGNTEACKSPTGDPTDCGGSFDVCTYTYTEDASGNKNYARACGLKTAFNGEMDDCESCDSFGAKTDQCVCNSDGCNGASGVAASTAVLLGSAVLRKLLD